jgi:(R)-benzylsuccinyl-CoA dehydrogenase
VDFELPFEVKMLQDIARRFTTEQLLPRERTVIEREMERGLNVTAFKPGDGEHHVFDPDGVLPREDYAALVEEARRRDLWALDVPEELGGKGLGVLGKMVVTEEIARSLVPFILPPDSPNLHWMLATCTPEQRVRYLEPYARGEISGCVAVTEPDAGSDASAIATRAELTDRGWVIRGRKMWISRADWADFIIVLARTDSDLGSRGGITAFIVDRTTPGLIIERRIAIMSADRPCEIALDDVTVPETAVLGRVGWAFPELQNRFSVRRIELAMRSIGAGERLLQLLVDQCNTRSTFGAPLSSRQSLQWWIADATAQLHAARLVCYNAAWKLDSGVRDVRYEASIAKMLATELVGQIADHTLQAYGGMGLAKELPIEFFYRMVRQWRIVEGPTEIHRMVVARNRLKDISPLPGLR